MMMRLDLSTLVSKEHPIESAEIKVNPETGNTSVVVTNELNGKAYVINKDGEIVKEDDCGEDSWSVIPTAEDYLDVYERYCDMCFQIVLSDVKRNKK